MTEFELATLFDEHLDSIVTVLFGYFSITSAFLAAIYLVGPSLPRFLAMVVVGLYSFTSIALIGWCERYAQGLLIIRNLILEEADWHIAAKEPGFILPMVMYLVVASMIIIFVASVWFFFYTRRNSNAPQNTEIQH